MSEIQVVIPMSALDGAKDLTPQGISEFLRGAIDNQQRAESAEHRMLDLKDIMRQWGTELQAVIDADRDMLYKFQKLRELATYARTYGSQL